MNRLEKGPRKEGRPAFDPVEILKIVALLSYYQLKEGQKIPNAKRLWLFKNQFSQKTHHFLLLAQRVGAKTLVQKQRED